MQAHRDGWRRIPQNPRMAFRSHPDSDAAAAWFAGEAGQALLASEAGCVHAALRQFPHWRGLWLGPSDVALPEEAGLPAPLRLHPVGASAFTGDLRCELPLPLASECCALVVVQHAADMTVAPEALLEECARVLIPGGWLWMLAINPLSPWRLRWAGQGLRGREPVSWRRRLRAVGLVPEPVSQGLGPTWRTLAHAPLRPGVGLRPAYLLRSEKRSAPLTPVRKARAIGMPAGTHA